MFWPIGDRINGLPLYVKLTKAVVVCLLPRKAASFVWKTKKSIGGIQQMTLNKLGIVMHLTLAVDFAIFQVFNFFSLRDLRDIGCSNIHVFSLNKVTLY